MPFRFSINSSKYVHFWTLALQTILIMKKFPFQRYISCELIVDHFVVCINTFLEFIGSYNNVKQEFYLGSKFFRGLYYMAWTIGPKVWSSWRATNVTSVFEWPKFISTNRKSFWIIEKLFKWLPMDTMLNIRQINEKLIKCGY